MSGTFFIIKQNKTKIAALLLALLLAACGGGSANIKDSSSSGLSITKPEKQSGVQQRTSGSQNTGVSVTLPDKDLVRERIEDGMPYHKAIIRITLPPPAEWCPMARPSWELSFAVQA